MSAARLSSGARTDERRFGRGAWLTLTLVAVFLIGGVLCVLAAFRQPSDGWNSVYIATTGWRVTTNQGGSDVLHAGDRILAIEQHSVDFDLLPRREPPPAWQPGGTAQYTVLRDGRRIELDVPLVQTPASALPHFLFVGESGDKAALVLCLGFCLAVFLLRPGSVAARLLLLIVAYFAGNAGIWLAAYGPTRTFWPPLLFWAFAIANQLWPLMFVMVAHLALVFPVRSRLLGRRPRRTLGILYGLPIAGCIASLALGAELPYIAAIIFALLAMACAVVGAAIGNLRATRDPATRAQIAWVALGLGGTFVLIGLLSTLSIIFPQMQDGGYVILLVLPLCLGIAITRYRLFDIDIIIRRTLVYAVLTLTLGATYLAGVVLLQALFVRFTGQQSALAVVASTLGIAALFGPLRRRVQAVIDRRFFRRKYDARLVLEQFAVRAQQQADLDALAGDMLSVVHETVQPQQAQLWLVPGRERR